MGINFQHIEARLKKPDTSLPEHSYEHWVNLTAKLIGRPYITTAKLVEKWPLEKIVRRYEQATKHCPVMSKPAIHWWALRKRELTND